MSRGSVLISSSGLSTSANEDGLVEHMRIVIRLKYLVYLDAFQDLFHRDIKEMKDAFEQNDVYLDEIENQNDLLKDQLLEASLTARSQNLDCSKRIVELEKDLSKSVAKSIAFEIALQHMSRENNSLKTVQKENENFMASLQLKNAHLKQTYKDLFESVQRSKS
ncbi:hypothetical protein Tco_0604380 [Tanacetum coccineum]